MSREKDITFQCHYVRAFVGSFQEILTATEIYHRSTYDVMIEGDFGNGC